jgi:predicted transposase YbfD/YdcC
MPPQVPSLVSILADLPDVRHARGKRHALPALLTLACLAMLCGADSQTAIADWLTDHDALWRTRLGFTHAKGPTQSTFSRLFQTLPIAAFEAALAAWAEHVYRALRTAPPANELPPPLAGLALDGKTLRGSATSRLPGRHLLSAFTHQCGLVLGQTAVADKTNEITVAPRLLAGLVLEGRLVTADALLTQRAIAAQIVAAKGDYLLVVKENQPDLLADVQAVFAAGRLLADTIQQAYTVQLHGNRIEERALQASTALAGYSDWPGLAQVLEVSRVVTQKGRGRWRYEVAYAITSLPPERASADQLLGAWQAHWEIENRLHWVRDVTFGEDRAGVRAGAGPQVLAALRNTVIGLLRGQGASNLARSRRRYAAQPQAALTLLGLPS